MPCSQGKVQHQRLRIMVGICSSEKGGVMRSRRRVVLSTGVLCLMAASAVHGGDKPAANYKIVGRGVFQASAVKNLKKAAAAGYRIHLTSGPYMIIMEKVPEGGDHPDYLFLEKLPRVIDEGVAQGYCYAPGTLNFDGDVGTSAVFERCPSDEAREYLYLRTEGGKTLLKEINQAVAEGWEFVDLASGGHPSAILERRAQTAGRQPPATLPSSEDSAQPPYLYFGAEKYSSMEKNLQEAAQHGYRPISAQPMGHGDGHYEVGVVLQRVGPSVQSNQYKLLAATRDATLEKEMNEAVSRGYQALPATFVQKTTFFGGEHGIVMEKRSGTPEKLVYMVLSTTKLSTLEKKINQAVKQGYRISGLAKRGNWVLMEKSALSEAPSP